MATIDTLLMDARSAVTVARSVPIPVPQVQIALQLTGAILDVIQALHVQGLHNPTIEINDIGLLTIEEMKKELAELG